jgi:transmembrane protein EpsG
MTLTRYRWLLIWLFLGGFLFNNMPRRRERLNGQIVERWDIWPAILMVVPYIIWAGFRPDTIGDTSLYRRTFLKASTDLSQIFVAYQGDTKDPGFSVLVVILKNLLGNHDKLFFLTIAAFQMLSIAFVFRKYTHDYWACIFLFIISTDYLSWMHNGIRQFIAVCIVFCGFGFLVRKKYIPMILLILLASQLHGSAILMLPIIFIVQGKAWNIKTMILLAVTIVAVVFIDRFTPVLNDMLQDTQYDDIMTNEIWMADDGTNILRAAVYSIPALLSLVGLPYVRAANNQMINVCVNCSIMTMALYIVSAVTSGIYIGRLPIYTTFPGYIALPWLIDHIFEEKSAKLMRVAMYMAYIAFFYYQTGILWGAF